MKNILLKGLQRSGTNYFKQIIDKNINVNLFYTNLSTESHYQNIPKYLKNVETGDYIFDLWKHNLTPLDSVLIEEYKIDGFVLIIKNPYSWIESIVYRTHIDLVETYNERYNVFEDGLFRIDNLSKLYKELYENWLNKAYLIKYEDLLLNKKKVLIDFANEFNLKLKHEKIENISEKVAASHQFNDSFIKKYINVELSHLSIEQICLINETIGEDFFNKIGYELKSPN